MKLLVIDGNSIVNRAFYGIRPLTNREGVPTHAVYGFLTILQKHLEVSDPDALCVAFDRREPTFRHLAYEEYKAQRKGMPEELAVQLPILKEVLDAMNIPRYELAGWEADDLIGTISRRCEAAGWDCIVVTGDKDSLQLVTDHTYVNLVSTRAGNTTVKEIDPSVFRELYGFEPPQLVDLKALMGDASDHIPGVAGVGEKTAMHLLHSYGTLNRIYDTLDELELKPAVRKKLEAGREMAYTSYDLATIRCDAPMEFRLEETIRKPANRAVLRDLFARLEFSKFIDQMGLRGGEATTSAEHAVCADCTIELVTDAARAKESLELWRKADAVSVLALPDLRGVAVGCGMQIFLLFADKLETYQDCLQVLFSAEIKKRAHDSKDLMRLLLEEGFSTEGFVFDTALAAYLLAPTDGSYDLEKLALSYFQKDLPKAKVYLSGDAFAPLDEQTAAQSAFAAHCGMITALYDVLVPRLDENGLRELYERIELPLCPVLAEMETAGFLIDRKALAAFGGVLRARIGEIQTEIYAQAGTQFNINSTQQLGAILFEQLGLPPVKKTKTGYSTSIEVLERLRGQHPIIDSIMEYRQLTKLNSTYVEGLSKVIAPDGRIHTCFQNTVTATGRLSSTEPNLQNIPVRTPLGAQMRNMFVAQPSHVLVDADYSQIELRLLAHIAGDTAMIEAFRSGTDIHTVTAAQVFGTPVEQVTAEMRRRAKAVNFGIVYGISEFSLAQDIGVARWEAKEYMDRYFDTYSAVRAYMYDIIKQAKQAGYVCTVFGRRRWLPELTSSNYNMRAFGERVALNMPIQGTAADVMKLAMIRVRARLKREGRQARLVLQVHDELIVECPEAEAEQVKLILVEEMKAAGTFAVPLETDAHIGMSWAEAKGS